MRDSFRSLSIRNLFANFKSVVELVIKLPGDSLTTHYGAIERLGSAIFAVLLHGLKQAAQDKYEHLWQLIVRLNSNSQKYIHLLQEVYHKENLRLSIEQWINQSLLAQCLSQQLSCIEEDAKILEQCYSDHAFMRVPPFYYAFMLCIRAIESNDVSLLATIDPQLYISESDGTTSTINDVIFRPSLSKNASRPDERMMKKLSHGEDKEQFTRLDSFATRRIAHRRIQSDPTFFNGKPLINHPSVIASNLFKETEFNRDDNALNPSYSYEYGSSYDSRIDSFASIEQSLSTGSSRQSISSRITLIDENEFQYSESTKSSNNLDLAKNVRLPYSSLFWPREGQTLESYIRECDSQTRTDVEKENAHFYFSEAIISAIEYVKFNEKYKEYCSLFPKNSVQSSDFNINRKPLDSNPDVLSAEIIALAVLEAWNSDKIPAARELFWMIPYEEHLEEIISTEDQRLIDPSDDCPPVDGSQRILRRGNNQWAPPRKQLIFHIHQSVNRDTQLKNQGLLCAGCGRGVEQGFAHRFRYCEYTGKYFCRSCHTDKKFYLPSYIITKWEFSNKHSLSNFAYEHLNQIYKEALFHINDLNPKLFKKSSSLKEINQLRWTLYFLRPYILSCRFADENGHQHILRSLPSYIYEDPYIYSLEDLIKTKSGELRKLIEPIVITLRKHALSCTLCCAKGHSCQICNNEKDIVFPFNIQTASTCPNCQSCFHNRCYEKNKSVCPKCQRVNMRNSVVPLNQNDQQTTD